METSNDVWKVNIKTEIKIEDPFPELYLQTDAECFIKDQVKQLKIETVMCNNDCEIDAKTFIPKGNLVLGLASQNESEYFSEDPLMVKNVEIKQEYWWPKTSSAEAASVYDEIKERTDEDFPPTKSPRLCKQAVSTETSDESPLFSDEFGKDINFTVRNDNSNFEDAQNCRSRDIDIAEAPSVEKNEYKLMPGVKNKVSNKSRKLYRCDICEKSYTCLSGLKRHNLIHEGIKPYNCPICGKSFTRLSVLKRHNLIHEGKKPYKCEVCEKTFTLLPDLKRHKLTHEGIKPYNCVVCNKSFTRLSYLKAHNLIHEGKNPYKCDIKQYKCDTCEKGFTRLRYLKSHHLIHEGLRPFKCNNCEKTFTRLSCLKNHNLIHEGKKYTQM